MKNFKLSRRRLLQAAGVTGGMALFQWRGFRGGENTVVFAQDGVRNLCREVNVAVSTIPFKKDPPWTIGYDVYFTGNSWSIQQEEESRVERDANSSLVADWIEVSSELSVDKQIANIETLIARGADVILITPNSPVGLGDALTEAANQGIPVVLNGAAVFDGPFTTFISIDDESVGELYGNWISEKLGGTRDADGVVRGGSGKVIVLRGVQGISVETDRFRGYSRVLAENPGIEVLGGIENAPFVNYSTPQAKQTASQLLAAFPEVDAILSDGGNAAAGVLQALAEAGRGMVPITGEDNNDFLKGWLEIKQFSSFRGEAVINPENFDSIAPSKPVLIGSEAVRTAFDILRGVPVSRVNCLDPRPIQVNLGGSSRDEQIAQLRDFAKPCVGDGAWIQTRFSDAKLIELFGADQTKLAEKLGIKCP